MRNDHGVEEDTVLSGAKGSVSPNEKELGKMGGKTCEGLLSGKSGMSGRIGRFGLSVGLWLKEDKIGSCRGIIFPCFGCGLVSCDN